MTLLSLCSGIGGLELGLEWAGFDLLGQAEKDPYALGILARHWPDAWRAEDVRAVGPEWKGVDCVAAGFPCQPHSLAGKRKASEDDRDLWPEMVRVLRDVRPRFFVGENVPGLLSSEGGAFFGKVLGDIYDLGYAVEWEHLPAVAVGAPHRRDRVFLVARNDGGVTFPDSVPQKKPTGKWPKAGRIAPDGSAEARERRWPAPRGTIPTPCEGGSTNTRNRTAGRTKPHAGAIGTTLCDFVTLWPTPSARDWRSGKAGDETYEGNARPLNEVVHRSAGAASNGLLNPDWVEWLMGFPQGWTRPGGPSLHGAAPLPFSPEPDIPRVTTEKANRVARLRCLGNAVVPHVAFVIGSAIRASLDAARETA
jgi:site-specific DNA-cytosine methylase